MVLRRILLISSLILLVVFLGRFSLRSYEKISGGAAGHLPGISVFRPPHEVSALAIWKGRIWAGGRDGLFALDPDSGMLEEIPQPDPPLRYVSALQTQDGNGLWIGHPGGLSLFDGAGYRNFGEADGLPDRRVTSLLLDSRGVLWVGTWKGAVPFTGHFGTTIDRRQGLADDMIRVMMEDHQGRLWFGSYVAPRGGLSIPSRDRWRSFTTKDGLPHNNVTSIFQDDRDIVWVGTGLLDRGGCALFSQSQGRWSLLKTLSRQDGLAGDKVRQVFQDSHGIYWIASEYGGVLRMRNNSQRILREKEGLSSNEVKAFLEDESGKIWMGTRDGVTRIDPSVFRMHHEAKNELR